MGRSPRLLPPVQDAGWGCRVHSREIIDPLMVENHIQIGRPPAFHVGPEDPLQLLPDDEENPGKARPTCIEDRKVQEGFSTWTHRLELLQAAVPGGHPGSQKDYRWNHGQ